METESRQALCLFDFMRIFIRKPVPAFRNALQARSTLQSGMTQISGTAPFYNYKHYKYKENIEFIGMVLLSRLGSCGALSRMNGFGGIKEGNIDTKS